MKFGDVKQRCIIQENMQALLIALVFIKTKETIIDFKQSNKPKKDEWIEDYYLQCAAYALAHDVVHGSKISQAVILLCTKDNIFQKFLIDGERLKNYQNKFLEKVEQFYAQRRAN